MRWSGMVRLASGTARLAPSAAHSRADPAALRLRDRKREAMPLEPLLPDLRLLLPRPVPLLALLLLRLRPEVPALLLRRDLLPASEALALRLAADRRDAAGLLRFAAAPRAACLRCDVLRPPLFAAPCSWS